MINIVMVEDDNVVADRINSFVNKYCIEKNEKINIVRYTNAEDFLDNYMQNYDIVLMDVMLPGLNGMAAARKLRELDKNIVIIFATTMAKFAVQGYEVNALYYIIKPIVYDDFAFKLSKAIDIAKDNLGGEITFFKAGQLTRISTHRLNYVEVVGHRLIFHLGSEQIQGQGTMREMEERLESHGFLRANNCYLVNPKYIDSVKNQCLHMRNGDILTISYPRRKAFMASLANWLGEGRS